MLPMKWTQENNRVFVESVEGKFFFDMPPYFNIKDVHPDLIRLAEILLFVYWHRELFDYKFTRKGGENIGLAYSGGADSTAVYGMLPKNKVKCLYHARAEMSMGLLRHDNPLEAIKRNGVDCLVVPSNFEGVRQHYGLSGGFQTDIIIEDVGAVGLSPLTALVLLADYLKLGYLSMGIVLHPPYLNRHTGKYNIFHLTQDWLMWKTLFENAGLKLLLPVMPCFSIGSIKIANEKGLFHQSCLRGTGGIGCGQCYKCYLKAIIQGNPIAMNDETKNTIKTNKMRRAMVLSGRNHYNLDIPELRQYQLDTSYFMGYYKPSLETVPIEYRSYIETELKKHLPEMESGKFENILV
jgi:hypothetical protein